MQKILPSGAVHIEFYRAWIRILRSGYEDYKVSRRKFGTEREAEKYGKRVAERYNRIFGGGETCRQNAE